MDFCKSFNDKTKEFKDSVPIPVEVTAFSDRTFTYEIKTPQTSYFIKQACGIKYGARKPGNEVEPMLIKRPAVHFACLGENAVGAALHARARVHTHTSGGF
jgi:ribosomal protein L11